MVTIQELFKWGVDRDIPQLLDPPGEFVQINVGPGNKKHIPDTIGVGDPGEQLTDVAWKFPSRLPAKDESVGAIHAYQFMEHFSGEDAIKLLRDFERVLVPGGVVFIATPYPGSSHFYQALDHKSHWMEETWDWLFNNEYYKGEPWRLKVHACMLAGVVIRNLNMLTQLVKE